jgi:hypothetical protein
MTDGFTYPTGSAIRPRTRSALGLLRRGETPDQRVLPRTSSGPTLVSRLLRPRNAHATLPSPEGIFWDWPGDTEVILARKPG